MLGLATSAAGRTLARPLAAAVASRALVVPQIAAPSRPSSSPSPPPPSLLPTRRTFANLEDSKSAVDAYSKSCYFEMDFTISDGASVYEAIQKFAAFNIGALVTTDADGNVSGVISERDYINKIALLGRKSKDTLVKEISTRSADLVTATPHDPVEVCMDKMLKSGVRHLPLLDDDGKVIGMLSIKDIVKVIMEEKNDMIKTLSNFALGKGGHFIED